MSEHIEKKGKGVRKVFKEDRLEDKFSFNVSKWDFGGDEEKTREFMKFMYSLQKYSVYVRDVMIDHFDKIQSGIDEEAIKKALELNEKIERVFGGNFEKILMFAELYSAEELLEHIRNKGQNKEEELATLVAQKTAQMIAGMLQGMTFTAPVITPQLMQVQEDEDDAEIDDFDLD